MSSIFHDDENNLEVFYKQLSLWNKSKNPWREDNRTYVVYSRTRKHFFTIEAAINLIDNLMEDKDIHTKGLDGLCAKQATYITMATLLIIYCKMQVH